MLRLYGKLALLFSSTKGTVLYAENPNLPPLKNIPLVESAIKVWLGAAALPPLV